MSKFLKVSRILTIIGGVIATIVSLSYYLLLVADYTYGSAFIGSLVIVLIGIIASLVSVIAAAILSLAPKFGTISFFVTTGALIAGLITVMIEMSDNTAMLTTMPFYAIPLTLMLTGAVFTLIKEAPKKE